MGNELPPTPNFNLQAATANLVDANRDRKINHGGLEGMPFPTFVQMQGICEKQYEPGVDVDKAKAEDLVNFAHEQKLVIPDELSYLIRNPEKNVDKQDNSPDQIKSKTEDSSSAVEKDYISTKYNSEASLKTISERNLQVLPKVHPEIMARVVSLELKPVIVKPLNEKPKNLSNKPILETVRVRPVVENAPKKVVSETRTPFEPKLNIAEVVEDHYSNVVSVSEVVVRSSVEELAGEISTAESVEDMLFVSEQPVQVPFSELNFGNALIAVSNEFTPEETPAQVMAESEFIEVPDQPEVYEEVEKAPAVVVAEFMLQVMPAVTQEVYERVQAMEPEAAAEVSDQIEKISIVADRLHELVIRGETEGEEAKQIEAYLKREYEQLLVAVGIEPTEEILNDFIRYIYSAEYQIREDINLKEIEILDEGTHEKKLFDEQGVFSRAHNASVNLSRRLDKIIGKIVVNNFSS